jgi:hypothetical protein
MGLSPTPTATSYSGIYLNTAVGNFLSLGGSSQFRNMHFGIVSENSDVFAFNCHFENMVAYPSIPNTPNAIRTTGGSLTTNACSFDGILTHGIWANASELNIFNNTFSVRGRTGINSTNNLNTDFVYIRNNTFTIQNNIPFGGPIVTNRVGIRVDRNSRSSAGNLNLASLDISGNSITMNGLAAGNPNAFQQRGIWVFGTLPSIDIGLVSNNTINANSGLNMIHRQNGIEIESGRADRFRVLNNTVTYSDPTPQANGRRWAISMLNGTGINHRLQGNNTNAVGNNGAGYCGFHLEDIPNVTMCSNTTGNYEHGIHFFGRCNGLGFWGNTMNDHSRNSIRVQNNTNTNTMGFVGQHVRTSNRWNFAIRATDNSNWPPPSPNILVTPQNAIPFSTTVFDLLITVIPGPETVCTQPPNFGNEGGDVFDAYDHWVKDGASGASPTAAWEAKWRLLYKLLRFPALQNTDPSVTAFFNANYNSSAGKFAQADFVFLQSVQQIAEPQNNAVSSLSAQRDSLLSQIHIMDESNGATPPTGAPTPSQVAAKQALLNAWRNNFNNRNGLKQQLLAQREASIVQALQVVEGIATSKTVEANWKALQIMQLKQALGVAPGLNDLWDIAKQCPEAAGSSAITAIYMLPDKEMAKLLPDEQTGLVGNCAQSREEASADTRGAVVSPMLVSPNPTQGLLSVGLPEKTTKANWDILDAQGQTRLQGLFEDGTAFMIQVDRLPDGVYFLSVSTIDGPRYAQKFIVHK